MESDGERIRAAIEELTSGFSSVREVIKGLKENREALDTKDGISLLSMKNYSLLSYLHCLLLLASRRALGQSITSRSPPAQPFSTRDRPSRGSEPGDLVDSMIESRIVLEKIKTLETKLRYQIDKLVRVAEEPESSSNIVDDPLAFRPNPKNLVQVNGENGHSNNEPSGHVYDEDITAKDGIYHPPRVAPVPYTESSKNKSKSRDAPAPRTLSSLALSADPSRPHTESTSGMGSTPSLQSGRANYLKRLNQFEEENFTRVMMKKSDARRRLQDEEDLALGGDLGAGTGKGKGRRARAGGLDDEFGDVLKSIGRGGGVVGGRGAGDGYDELRRKGKKADVLERSRRSDGMRKRGGEGEEDEGLGRSKKRTRFELDAKAAKKRLTKRKKLSS